MLRFSLKAFLILEKIFKCFYNKRAEPLEPIINTHSTDGPKQNLMKIVQAVSEKTFKIYTILYMYIAKEQGQITQRGQTLIVAKKF